MASSRSLRSRLSRFAQVELRERLVVLGALVLLPPLALALQARGMSHARALGTRLARALPAADRRLPAHRVSVLVEAAAEALSDCGAPHVRCLARSLALCALLERRGERPVLRLGVPREASDAPFEAHAWVELDDIVLNDVTDVYARYVGLASV